MCTCLITCVVKRATLAPIAIGNEDTLCITSTVLVLCLVLSYAVDTLLVSAFLRTCLNTDIGKDTLAKVAYVETCTVCVTLTRLLLVAGFRNAVDTRAGVRW